MIIALAGRRIDAPGAHERRFPLHMTETVRQRLHDLFAEQSATALVCSGACGADLLALDVASVLGMHRRMILPFDRQRFRATSVTDREPSATWGHLFDRLADELAVTNDLITLDDVEAGQQAYAAVNRAILDEALRLAQGQQGSGEASRDVLAIVVWEGATRGAEDLTAALLDKARRRGFKTAEVLTSHRQTSV
jgi:hypothetical protein